MKVYLVIQTLLKNLTFKLVQDGIERTPKQVFEVMLITISLCDKVISDENMERFLCNSLTDEMCYSMTKREILEYDFGASSHS